MTVGPALGLAVAGLAAGLLVGPRWAGVWLAATLAGSAGLLAAAIPVLGGGEPWEWRSSFLVGGEILHFRLDAVSAVFLALLGVVGAAGAVYAHSYWADEGHPASAPRGRVWWSALMLSMGLVLVASNGLHFLIAWELFTLSAYFLITLDRQRSEVQAAGWLYLGASHAAVLALFAFFAVLAARTGSWELGPMKEHAELAPLFWLALFGFGLKAGLFPLHIWLPSAHANAPSHVSAIMSGVTIKLGIYGLVRFSGWLPVPGAACWVVVGLGVVSALLGVAFALGQHDLKRLLAYHSVENIGIILIGFGFGLVGAAQGNSTWGRLALAGALLHVWNHGLFKSLLFLGAGSVVHGTGTREMSRLGGLWRRMPWTAGLFAFGAVAICGLPPLNGFVSEWLVYLGLFDAAVGRGAVAWAAMPAAIALAVTGALALVCFVKVSAITFLGAPRTQAAARAHESGALMVGPMIFLAAGCLALALVPVRPWQVMNRVVAAWNPDGAAAGGSPVPVATLGAANAVLAVLLGLAVAGLWARTRRNGLRRALTWDCGYAAPTAHMQYTGGSFAAIATGWFSWLILPERRLRRPRGVFPVEAHRIEQLPDAVLFRIVGPVGSGILAMSTAVRRLQQGRLQFYILYLVAGLAALGVLVLAGDAP